MHELARILFVTKPRFIGDTVIAVPAMRSIRNAYPAAEFDLLTGPSAAEAVHGCPWLRQTKVLQSNRRKKPMALFAIARHLRAQHYDAVVLFERSFRSGLAAWLARVPVRVGFSVEMRGPLLTHRVPYDRSFPEVDCLLSLAEVLGGNTTDRRLELWVSEQERENALTRYGLERGRYVCFACGANEFESRSWPAEHFVEVGLDFHKSGYTVVLLGSRIEIEATRPVAQALGHRAVDLCGRTPLRDALALIAGCAFYLSAETGLSHCAVALGVPSVVVHSPFKVKRWGHNTDKAVALWTEATSEQATLEQIRQCLRSVTPEKVLQAAKKVMGEPSSAT